MKTETFDVVTITLNPAIDRTVTVSSFTAGAVNRVETERSNPGGKGVNVAARLAESGLRIGVTGFLGLENPTSFEEMFTRLKIADRFIRIPGRTRVGIKIVDSVLEQTTDLNFPGAAVSPANLESLAAQVAQLTTGCFVLAGSLPPGVDPSFYRHLTEGLRHRGASVILDASGEALRLALDAKPSLIKPNADELGELLGRKLQSETEIVAAARQLVAQGIETVAVSMGGDGACFVTASEAVIARPPRIEVQSTVGAGDAMVAGMVAARLRGLSLAESARLATAFSIRALTLSRQSGTPFSQSIREITPQVTINPLA